MRDFFLIMKSKAFLEMEEEPSAVSMVNYFTNCVAQLRERSVYVQFSNHTSLKTDQTHSNASASAQAALQAAQALAGAGENKAGGPNTVLRVIVEHMVYPVTLDVIFQIFSRVGKVMKIVTFTKNNTFQVVLKHHFGSKIQIWMISGLDPVSRCYNSPGCQTVP